MIVESLVRHGIDAVSLLHKSRRGFSRLIDASPRLEERRSQFYRRIWEDAAASMGASVEILSGALLEIRCGAARIRIYDNYTSFDDPVTLRIAGNKPLVHRLLQARGIPTPRYSLCLFDDVPTAWRFVSTLGRPGVVKPAQDTGAGNGVTAGIDTRRGLARAMAVAGAYSRYIVVEEQIDGDNFRLLYFDGEFLDAVWRHPPTVRGDGASSLRRLISIDNQNRIHDPVEAGQTLIGINSEVKRTLRTQGYGLRSVPRKGEMVRLKTVVSDNRREDNAHAAGQLCASVIDSGSAAASAVGARLAAVDIVTPNPSVSLERSGGAIIEVNTTPGLHYHYPPQEGDLPVASLILKHLSVGSP